MATDDFLLNFDDDDLPPLLLPDEDEAYDDGACRLTIDDPEEKITPDNEDLDDDSFDEDKTASKRRFPVGIVIAVLLLLAVLAGAFLFVYRTTSAPSGTAEPAEEESVPAEAPAEEETPAGEEMIPAAEEEIPAEEPAEEAPAEEASAAPAADLSVEEEDTKPAETAEEIDLSAEYAEAEPLMAEKPRQAQEMFGALLAEMNREIAEEAEPAGETEEEPADAPMTEEEVRERIRLTDRARFLGNTEVCGIGCPYTVTMLDLTDAEYCDLDEIREKIQAMPLLTRIILPPHTDYTNEEIDAFYKSLDGIRVIWTVWLGRCGLRTDTTYFCKNTSARGYVGSLSNEDYEPLRYCTDLIALDIGHGKVSDLSFLEPLTNLRYLILADDKYSDISVLANLTNLYYLELFLNTIDDISVLENLTNLRYLNIGWVSGLTDYSVLSKMTWLDSLWAPGNKMTDEEIAAVEAALPNATMHIARYTAYTSTDHGWRQTPGYYEMRDALHMYYMAG